MSLMQRFLEEKQPVIAALALQYGVSSLKVFGSVARGDDSDASDIDFLVNLTPSSSLFDLADFRADMETLFQWKVDVLMENTLHWYVRPIILKEARAIPLT